MLGDCDCGPAWFPKWIARKVLGHKSPEPCWGHEACKQHDLDYQNGVRKSKADANMLHRLVNASEGERQFKRAVHYYYLVKVFGWPSYWLARRK